MIVTIVTIVTLPESARIYGFTFPDPKSRIRIFQRVQQVRIEMQDLQPINAALARIADRVPAPAKPIFAQLLLAAENYEIPWYVRMALATAAGVRRDEDALLRAAAVLAFGHPGCVDHEAATAGAWRVLRSAPRADRRAAVQALRALRDIRRACEVFLPRSIN